MQQRRAYQRSDCCSTRSKQSSIDRYPALYLMYEQRWDLWPDCGSPDHPQLYASAYSNACCKASVVELFRQEGRRYPSLPWYWSSKLNRKIRCAARATTRTTDRVAPAGADDEPIRLTFFCVLFDLWTCAPLVVYPTNHLFARSVSCMQHSGYLGHCIHQEHIDSSTNRKVSLEPSRKSFVQHVHARRRITSRTGVARRVVSNQSQQ